MGAQLQQRHWSAFARTIEALAALPSEGDVLLALLRVIEGAIPATLTRFCALDPHSLDCIGVNTHLLSTGGEDLDALSPTVLARCPLVLTQLRPDAPAVLRLTDVVRSHEFWSTQSWEVYYRPASSRYTMSARLSPAGHVPIVTIDLDRDIADFSAEEARLLDLLRPHLREAYERVCAIERGRRPAPTAGHAGLSVTLDHAPRRLAVSSAGRSAVSSAGRRPGARGAMGSHDAPGVPGALGGFGVHGAAGARAGFGVPGLPASLREAVWLHYGSFSREELAGRPCAFERTLHDREGALRVSMAWDPTTARTLITTRSAEAGEGTHRGEPWRALLALDLTQREAEVLFWVAEGKSNDIIGRVLGVSGRTVQKHVENLHRKLGVESRTAAAATALRTLHRMR